MKIKLLNQVIDTNKGIDTISHQLLSYEKNIPYRFCWLG